MAKMSTLKENWVLNSNTDGLWGSYFGSTSISSRQCNYTINSGASNFAGFDSLGSFDLTDSYLFMELVNSGNQALVSLEVYLSQLFNGTNGLFWYLNQNVLQCRQKVAGVTTQIGSNLTYSSTDHKYFRIRELNGSIYWDYSKTGLGDWINQATTPTPITITSLKLELAAGTSGTEGSGTTVITGAINVIGGIKTGVNQGLRPHLFSPGLAR